MIRTKIFHIQPARTIEEKRLVFYQEQYFIRSFRIRLGDRKGPTSAEGCQHFTAGAKNANATNGHGVNPSTATEQHTAQAGLTPSPVHPSIGQTIGKRYD